MHVVRSFLYFLKQKVRVLTCGLGGELVPVGGAHGQQPVAQVQVEALLSSDATHHLEGRAAERECGPFLRLLACDRYIILLHYHSDKVAK